MRARWLCLLLGATAAAQAAPDAVVAHWPMHLEGAVVRDDGPWKLHGRAFGEPAPKPSDAPFGLALELLPRANAGVEVPSHAALDLKPPFTVAAWVRPGAGNQAMEVVCRRSDTDPGGYRLRVGWGMAIFQMGTGEAKPLQLATPARWLPAQHWVHLAAVHDGHVLRLFTNAEETVGVETTVAPPASRSKLVLGNYPGRRDAYPLVGHLGDVWLLSAALDGESLWRLATGR